MPTRPPHPRIRPAPLAWMAASLCAGTLLGSALPGRGEWMLAGCVLLLALFVAAGPHRVWQRATLLMAAAALLGSGLVQIELRRLPPDDVRLKLHGASVPLVRAVVQVTDAPRWSPGGTVLSGRLESLGGQAVSGKVRVRVGGEIELRAGDRVELLGELSIPGVPNNPGEADFARLDTLAGIAATLNVRSAGQVWRVSASSTSVRARWHAVVSSLLARGFDRAEEDDELLLRALFLGEVDARSAPIREMFQRLGVTHHLAVSGTHLAVVGGFVFLLLRLAAALGASPWLSPRVILSMTLAVVVSYGLAVVPGEAVTRSVLLAMLVGAGLLLGRGVSVINLLGACGVAMLLFDPLAGLRPGFQLTFFVVWALCAGTPALIAFAREYRDPDVLVADRWRESLGRGHGGGRSGQQDAGRGLPGWVRGGPSGWSTRWRRWKWEAVVPVAAASVVAWMAAAPIVAFHFQQVSPWAAAASVLLAPVVFLTIVVAGFKVVLSAVLPWGSGVWAEIAGWASRLLRESVEALAVVPGGDVAVPGLWGWAAALGVVGLCLPLVAGARANSGAPPGTLIDPTASDRQRVRGRRRRLAAWCAAAGMTLGMPLVPLLVRPGGTGLTMSVLSVGSAQCIVLHGPALGGRAVVIDCGSNGGDVYRRTFDPFYRQTGPGEIDSLVLTHSDADHTSGAEQILRQRGARRLVVGEGLQAAIQRENEDAPAVRAVRAARERMIPVEVVAAGDTLDWGEVRLDVIHPPRERWRGLGDNDASLVLRVAYAGRVVVVGSDVEEPGQRMLMTSPALLRADVLIAPHHGSWEPTLLPLVRATEAATVVVSDDTNPGRGQRRFFDELSAASTPELLRTSQRGTITLHIAPDGTLRITPFRKP